MEDYLTLTSDEHKILKKFKTRLEKRNHVAINMPNTVEFSESDVIFVSIVGEKCNIENVKNILSEKIKAKNERTESQQNVVLITLSDSEDCVSSDSESEENSESKEISVCIVEELANANNYPNLIEKSSVCNSFNNSVCIIDSQNSESKESSVCIEEELVNANNYPNLVKKSSVCNSFNDSVCIIDSLEDPKTNTVTHQDSNGKKRKAKQQRLRNRKRRIKDISLTNENEVCEISSTVEFCEVSSTTEETIKMAQLKNEKLADFIPLGQGEDEKKIKRNKGGNVEKENDIILLKEPVSAPRPLRPVVIDGSNVAMEHGKVSHCFSAKGIQLAVEYFLKRGHTDVHAFIPKFRRISNPHHNFPTKDPEILDELAAKQLVVFTPSRRVNGKCIASYDDRFIVDLASKNGGVILSNDNYRDLIGESDSFKEAIEKRLLMFCFVGDIIMIPADPLGRNGPSLEDFLSFPPESKL